MAPLVWLYEGRPGVLTEALHVELPPPRVAKAMEGHLHRLNHETRVLLQAVRLLVEAGVHPIQLRDATHLWRELGGVRIFRGRRFRG